MDKYYSDRLEESNLFQDHWAKQFLLQRGITLQFFCSKQNQLHGECIQGYELKFDQKFRQTKRLYIETHEKKRDASKWIESGILKVDNSIFIAIGDYNIMFVFSKQQLVSEYKKAYWNSIETPTSKGFVIDMYENGTINDQFKHLVIDKIKSI